MLTGQSPRHPSCHSRKDSIEVTLQLPAGLLFHWQPPAMEVAVCCGTKGLIPEGFDYLYLYNLPVVMDCVWPFGGGACMQRWFSEGRGCAGAALML
jgi:hypothetical protein